MNEKLKLAIAGSGYVGLSLSMLLSKKHEVIAIDISSEKVRMLNDGHSPLKDNEIQEYLNNHKKSHKDFIGSFKATICKKEAYKDAEFVVVATPTDYDSNTNSFDTSSVEAVIEDVILINPSSTIIIKSTVPIGYTRGLIEKYDKNNIIFSPEFLREGSALYDNLYPSRIIVGNKSVKAKKFGNALKGCALKDDVELLYTDSSEAEAIKLFSNVYLAMRISYFNELDTYAEIKGLNPKQIIQGIGLDTRIGLHYNNPSFGYGGYCLPKDTRQLQADFQSIPNVIISSIHRANENRKNFIAEIIINKKPKALGVYRLAMKSGSDNFRESAIYDVIQRIKKNLSLKIFVFEPAFPNKDIKKLSGCELVTDLKDFKAYSDIIIANRMDNELDDVIKKVYTRDIFNIC